jgi:glutathione synthase/RimK-type ligase-like ATP-grasp enzyme
MSRILLLTPATDNPAYVAVAPTWFARHSAALATAGFTTDGASWTEPFDPSRYAAVMPLLTWGYHFKLPQWLALLDRLEASGVPVLNPVPTLRWNTAKTYLGELASKGAPVVPTLTVDRVTSGLIEEARQRFGSPVVVAKPQVSGGSHETVKLAPGDPLDGAPSGPALIQPFLPAVGEEGELALFYFGGRYSHAVTKVAAPGDFRVQVQFGGVSTPIEPPPEAFAVAEAVLAAAPPITYARIDMIRSLEGRLALMELEAIEPDLFLEHAPDGGAMFGAAVRAALGIG